MSKSIFRFHYFAASLVLAISILGTSHVGDSASGQFISNNTPPFVRTAPEIGPADASQTIEITVWLNVHNRQQLDSVAEDLYDPTSPHYRAWLSFSQITADYGPKVEEANTVKEFLSAHDLSIVLVDPNNFFVRARGTIAQVSAAFRIKLSNFNVRGKVVRANTTDPYIEGAAGSFVHLISGLSDLQSDSAPISRFTPSASPPSLQSQAGSSTSPLNSYFASNCFHAPVTDVLTTNGGLPAATYKGNLYDSTNVGGCGYTPPEIYTAYNLSALYKEGYDGNGQTIVIFEVCNTATIQSDANAFSAQFGLPALTSVNFSVIEYPVPAPCDYPSVEESLDVEWAHAIAPGANIVVLVTPNFENTNTGFPQDIEVALLYATAHHLGNVISFSYGWPESYIAPADLDETNLLAQLAAISGISANFCSQDDGDYTDYGIPATVAYPASTQYGTAVGGISLALNNSNAIEWQSGWGTNLNLLDNSGLVSDPPLGSFSFGSGGGSSAFFSKPDFQHRLPGSFRRLPDISWIADPYTGVVIDLSYDGVYPPREWFAIGGTSVACPMFSALWAIANQEAGTPLGQAARYIYSMPSSTITDIVPVGSSTNVAGVVTDASGLKYYSASDLAQPLEGTTVFYSALWNVPLNQNLVYLVTFGTDSSLRTAPGWDDVTGVGVPKPKEFADFFAP